MIDLAFLAVFLAACQRQLTPTAITLAIEPSILRLAEPEIDQPTAKRIEASPAIRQRIGLLKKSNPYTSL